MAARKKSKRTAFVPRLILGTAVAAVVPACAMGCGSSEGSNDDAGIGPVGVACPAFQCGQGVAAQAFDGGRDASDAARDAPSDHAAQPDVGIPLGVAAVGFDAAAGDGAPDGDAHGGDGADAAEDADG